jgi:P27 family predicted phage terminase small subunit
MRGRRPKPTKLKALEGNRGKRPLNENEPQPPAVTITNAKPPAFLDATARIEWNRQVPQLIHLGILTSLDLSMFAAYCESFSTYIDALARIKKLGKVVIGSRGTLTKNPYLRIAREAKQDMLRFAQEYGITPGSRTRLHVEKEEAEDAFDKFLNGQE